MVSLSYAGGGAMRRPHRLETSRLQRDFSAPARHELALGEQADVREMLLGIGDRRLFWRRPGVIEIGDHFFGPHDEVEIAVQIAICRARGHAGAFCAVEEDPSATS